MGSAESSSLLTLHRFRIEDLYIAWCAAHQRSAHEPHIFEGAQRPYVLPIINNPGQRIDLRHSREPKTIGHLGLMLQCFRRRANIQTQKAGPWTAHLWRGSTTVTRASDLSMVHLTADVAIAWWTKIRIVSLRYPRHSAVQSPLKERRIGRSAIPPIGPDEHLPQYMYVCF